MPIEFVVSLNKHNEYPLQLGLPEVFDYDAYTGNGHLYLTGITRNRKRVTIVKTTEGVLEIRGQRWTEFVSENIDDEVKLLHFIEEGDDSFYVTGYDSEGIETGGYEGVRRRYSRFQTRVMPPPFIFQTIQAEFVAGLGNEETITISCEADDFDVRVSRVNPFNNTVLLEFVLNQADWNALCGEKNLEYGDVVVFTKIRNDLLNLMVFNSDGSGKTDVQFLGATRLNLVQPKLAYEEQNDDRMSHICILPTHIEHFNERTDMFYKSFVEILAFNRLCKPAKFQERHPMHLYTKAVLKQDQTELPFSVKMDRHYENPGRTNHVNMFGEWKFFGKEFGLNYKKMLRFRLMYVVTDLEGPQPTRYPFFHVC